MAGAALIGVAAERLQKTLGRVAGLVQNAEKRAKIYVCV